MGRAARIVEEYDRRRRLGLWFRVVDADGRDLLVDLDEVGDLLDELRSGRWGQ